jgi:hypothetical protein
MEAERYLIATAQISLAMAGFAGVVAAYRNQSNDGWGIVERFWLRLLLLNSILPFAFSLIGIFILVVDPSRSAWRWSSGIAATCLVLYALMIVKHLKQLPSGALKEAGSGLIVSRTLLGSLIVVCILQFWNAAILSAFWPFLAAIMALNLGAIFQFARLVLTSHRPNVITSSDDSEEEL